jgi:hypothetical protein
MPFICARTAGRPQTSMVIDHRTCGGLLSNVRDLKEFVSAFLEIANELE